MNYDTGTARDDAYEGRALVAAFADRETAHAAAHALHDEGFGRTWIGVTHASEDTTAYAGTGTGTTTGQTQVTSDGGDSLGDKIGRFFSGASGDRTLYDELVRHGVASSEARRIDGSLAPNSAILTVDGHNHPELAATLIEQNGGHILAGESFGTGSYATDTTATTASAVGGGLTGGLAGTTAVGTTGAYDAATDATTLRGSQVLGYGDSSSYARGEQIDEERRIKLREERLSVDKQRVQSGEVQITKDVVEHQQDIDVPVIREELFVERRPVSETTADAGEIGEIGAGETIRVPLMREQVAVTKRAVVTGEVVVGKREVTETQRVSDTTREEKLRVGGDTTNVRASGYDGDTTGTTGSTGSI
jgi:uncharacterized protein (TIGR02271 family)